MEQRNREGMFDRLQSQSLRLLCSVVLGLFMLFSASWSAADSMEQTTSHKLSQSKTERSTAKIELFAPVGKAYEATDICGDRDKRSRTPHVREKWEKATCLLLIKWQNSTERMQATGFLVEPRLILTAGHCVFDVTNGWAESIEVRPGANGPDDAPFGRYFASKALSVRGWTESQINEYDYTALQLNTDEAYKKSSNATFQMTPALDDELIAMTVWTIGYPINAGNPSRQVPTNTQWQSRPEPTGAVRPLQIKHLCDTSSGNSGGPILNYSNLNQAVAIHVRGGCASPTERKNTATRLTADRVDRIKREWNPDH